MLLLLAQMRSVNGKPTTFVTLALTSISVSSGSSGASNATAPPTLVAKVSEKP